jgi:hypothetical protein
VWSRERLGKIGKLRVGVGMWEFGGGGEGVKMGKRERRGWYGDVWGGENEVWVRNGVGRNEVKRMVCCVLGEDVRRVGFWRWGRRED